MPSKSEKQRNFMRAACYNKEFAKKAGIDQKVACEFNKEDEKIKMKENTTDLVDTIIMDVPLFLRVLEYAREDAKTDLDLHDLAEKAIALSKEHILTMSDYEAIIPDKEVVYEQTVSALFNYITESSKKWGI